MMESKDEAIDRVEDAANEKWKSTALRAVRWRAKKGVNFTSDHIWADLVGVDLEPPKEPRAMGAIMRKAVSEGLIVATDKTIPSTKPSNHKRPVRVWSPITKVKLKVCDSCGKNLPDDLRFHQFHSIQESSVLCTECYGAWCEYKDFLLQKVAEQKAASESKRKNIEVTETTAKDEV